MPVQSHFVNQLEVRVTGMSRSGNHAIINWLLQQAEVGYCFLNCSEPKYNPFETVRPLDNTGKLYLTDIDGFSLEREKPGSFSPKSLLLFSHEDAFLGPLGDPRWERRRDDWVGRSHRRVDLLILRDPFNLFASRFRFGSRAQPARHGAFSRTGRRIWQQHARQYLGERQHFPGEWGAISYNRWTLDRGYREKIARWLGLRFTDAGFEEIPACAGGSSFDGVAADPIALRCNVHTRWQLLREDPLYRSFFDPTTCELADRCFPGSRQIGERLAELDELSAG